MRSPQKARDTRDTYAETLESAERVYGGSERAPQRIAA